MMKKSVFSSAALLSMVALLGAQQPKKQTPAQGSASPAQVSAGSQQPSAPQQSSDDESLPKFVQTVKEVMAPVTVTDRDGKVVNGLTALDFRLLDNGKPQVFSVDTLAHPISLVVAVQANAAVESIIPQIQKIGSVFDDLVI